MTLEQHYETLRAMTKPCGGIFHVDGEDSGRGRECQQCRGNGTVSMFTWLWRECLFLSTHEEVWTQRVSERYLTEDGECRECLGTRLLPRTPTSDEVEDALLEQGHIYFEQLPKRKYWDRHADEYLLILHNGLKDKQKFFSNDPRECRLLALIEVAKERAT